MRKYVFPFVVTPILLGIICCLSSEKQISSYIDKVIINTSAILVGLLIAVVGILLASINGLYLSLYKIVKSTHLGDEVLTDEEVGEIKGGLDSICIELKQNTIFALFLYGFILILSVLPIIDIPNVRWIIESNIFTKIYAINLFTLWSTVLIFYSVYDCIMTCFRLTDSFKIVKVK